MLTPYDSFLFMVPKTLVSSVTLDQNSPLVLSGGVLYCRFNSNLPINYQKYVRFLSNLLFLTRVDSRIIWGFL